MIDALGLGPEDDNDDDVENKGFDDDSRQGEDRGNPDDH